MSQYTVELRTLINVFKYNVFNFNYPFYTDDNLMKKEFEELFINRYYFHEIGSETYDRWQHMLKTRLTLIMPYYAQLYQTEWEQTKKDMMQSKDLIETTTRTLKSKDESSGESSGTSSGESTSQGETSATMNESRISDGVSIVNLEEGNKTGTTSDSGLSSSDITSNATSSSESKSSSETDLEEIITFQSTGDVGIQTPAYAITEWRKVIININEMILNDLADLFMQIY